MEIEMRSASSFQEPKAGRPRDVGLDAAIMRAIDQCVVLLHRDEAIDDARVESLVAPELDGVRPRGTTAARRPSKARG